jgi:hypothetical protein
MASQRPEAAQFVEPVPHELDAHLDVQLRHRQIEFHPFQD